MRPVCYDSVRPSTLPSTLKNIVQDGRATVRGWLAYKRHTGRWPLFPIAIHSLNWLLMISGMAALVWCSGAFHWSRAEFTGVHLVVVLSYAVLWWWVKVTDRSTWGSRFSITTVYRIESTSWANPKLSRFWPSALPVSFDNSIPSHRRRILTRANLA